MILSYKAKKASPIFDDELKSEILSLDNNSAINTLARVCGKKAQIISVGEVGVISTFNTKWEFEKIRH